MALCLQELSCLFQLPEGFAMKPSPFALRERTLGCEHLSGIAKVGPLGRSEISRGYGIDSTMG